MKKMLVLIAMAFATTAFAAEPAKAPAKAPAKVEKKEVKPKAPPSATKPTPKKKIGEAK